MKLDILICTYNSGINHVPQIILPESNKITYKISHQVTDSKFINIPNSLVRNDITISQINSKGLSLNRNNALMMADADICLIADDDVKYNLQSLYKIIEIFEKNKDLDIVTGQIETYGSEPEYKKYKTSVRKVSWLNVGSISSIEIAFRTTSVKNYKIRFDENFGLSGKIFNKGEEVIFITDCLKYKLNIKYYPLYIVKHHYQSSGKKNVYDINEVHYWGGLCQRIFGIMAYFFCIMLCFKHYNRYKKCMSPLSYILCFIDGMNIIKAFQKTTN